MRTAHVLRMQITENTKEVSIYTVGDREFLSKSEAEAYLERENAELKRRYYVIRAGFDGTEGRGFFHHEVVSVAPGAFGAFAVNALVAYCLAVHGPAVLDFYGRPTDGWRISDPHTFDTVEALDQWLREQRRTHSSSYRYGGEHRIDNWGNIETNEVTS